MSYVQRVVLRTNEYASRVVDQVEIFVGGAWYRRDIGQQLDVALTQRLADENGVELEDHRKREQIA
jgi:hypothetical protein